MDTDEEWAVRIRNLKFESFNQEWLDVVQAPPDQVGCCTGLQLVFLLLPRVLFEICTVKGNAAHQAQFTFWAFWKAAVQLE